MEVQTSIALHRLLSSDGKGCVVERSVLSPYKLSRAGNCFPRLEEIPEVAVERTRPSSDGQHYGDTLSEQGRRDQVQVLGLEGQGDYSLVSEHEDHIVSSTYLGTGYCQGGSPLSVSNRESLPIGAIHQMVSRSQGNRPTLWYLRPTYSRPVRHSANNKVEEFFSHLPDPLALQGNSLQADWSKGLLNMYPPLPLLSLALHKMIREEAQAIAILPWWQRRGWFPLVLQLLVDLPVMLPERDGLLLTPDRTELPDLGELGIATCRLPGDHSTAEAFERSCCHHMCSS